MKEPQTGHDWTRLPGSNVSFVCLKCGMLGSHPIHSPHQGDEVPRPVTAEPCEVIVATSVMKS